MAEYKPFYLDPFDSYSVDPAQRDLDLCIPFVSDYKDVVIPSIPSASYDDEFIY